jgi:SAM-dependent methyltransferase
VLSAAFGYGPSIVNVLHGIRRSQARRRRAADAAKQAVHATPGLITTVSPKDDMMSWGRPEQYFSTGRWSPLAGIERGLAAARVPEPRRILDLPSGYGRVLRYLKVTWPSAALTACDIMAGAVDFCAKTFDARPIVSQEPLWEVDIGSGYDLIWSGSLLTHFDADHWQPILRHFANALSRQGVLVFSTHGRRSLAFLSGSDEFPELVKNLTPYYGLEPSQAARVVESVNATGFGFSLYPRPVNEDYGSANPVFGVSVALPRWVEDQISAVGLCTVLMEDGGWGKHQDLWTATRHF